MAASYVTRESAKKLESMGLDLDVYESLVTVTCLRNALEAMTAKDKHMPNAFIEMVMCLYDGDSGLWGVACTLTDAESMAAAVIEYLEWRSTCQK